MVTRVMFVADNTPHQYLPPLRRVREAGQDSKGTPYRPLSGSTVRVLSPWT